MGVWDERIDGLEEKSFYELAVFELSPLDTVIVVALDDGNKTTLNWKVILVWLCLILKN